MATQIEWRVAQLEKRNEELEAEIQKMKDERNVLLGVGTAAKWGIKAIVVLAGWGALRFISDILHWLNMPMVKSH